MLVVTLLTFGILARLLPHEHNFTPFTAIALFGGVYLSRRYAVILPLALMVISDIFIGLHDTIFFTWGSVILIALLGSGIKDRKTPAMVLGSSVVSALLFFIITNFGAWLSDLYPHNFKGLLDCYILAIPFFRSTLVSSVLYSVVLFGSYELAAFGVRKTRLAKALLTI